MKSPKFSLFTLLNPIIPPSLSKLWRCFACSFVLLPPSCLPDGVPPSPSTRPSLSLSLIYPSSSALPLPLPSFFSLSLCTVIHFSPSVSLSIFTLSFSPPHVVLLSIPLYSLPPLPSPPLLSSLAHIWFLSLDLCVFGVTQSSLGLPAHMCVCVTGRDRETEWVYVCRLTGLPAWACFCFCVLGRVQQGSSRLCNSF